MSTFNKTTRKSNNTEVTNKANGQAFKVENELELYSAVCTALMNEFSYEKSDERLERIKTLISKVDPAFVAKLAVYAREKMNLRTIPLILSVELAKIHKNDNLVSSTVSRVIQRADELAEILAIYQALNNRTELKKLNKLSNQLKKGIAKAFDKFDEYQFAKYNRQNEVKLRDALFITHPKPSDDKQKELFKKIAEDTLTTPNTWEVKISEAGSDPVEKCKAWEKLIDENALGYMALLRNLRNILQANVSKEHILKVCQKLENENEVKRSKQFPFRFLSAYIMLSKANGDVDEAKKSLVLKALETAVKFTASNYKGIGETDSILIASDVSGSMFGHKVGGEKSSVTAYDVGLLMSMLLRYHCNFVDSGFFGSDWKLVNLESNEILKNTVDLKNREGEVGYSTNGFKVIDWAIKSNKVYDKIMLFTDCQLWNDRFGTKTINELWKEYKKINPKCKLYMFDLSGYGTSPVKIERGDAYIISGFSDKVFDMLDSIENGSSIIKEINKITI